jgi:NTE family protein
MHETGIEPDWVIGTSIGAINGALIAGNPVAQRLERLRTFWNFAEGQSSSVGPLSWMGMDSSLATMNTVLRGIPNFFVPNSKALFGMHADVGVEAASYYSTAPLRESLSSLINPGQLGQCNTRLTVGAVHARSGEMRYFDSSNETLSIDHVMASGALPPAFPAIRIDGEPYWDGGIYSNTPIEAVFDDHPRRDSVIFAVDVWQPDGPEPQSIWQVMGRQKDIQYASRTESHLARQEQIQRLRRVIRELEKHLPAGKRSDPEVRELASYGCGATMHVLRLLAPRLEGESQTKDIDFTAAGVRARWQAGYADTLAMIERSPWEDPADPIAGVVEHLGAER